MPPKILEVGDRVEQHAFTTAKVYDRKADKVLCYWSAETRMGTVIEVQTVKRGRQYHHEYYVRPDPPGTGAYWFRRRQIKRVEQERDN